MTSRLSALLAVLSLCAVFSLPTPAMAGNEILVSIGRISPLQAEGDLVSVEVTFTCATTDAYSVVLTVYQSLLSQSGLHQAEGQGKRSGHCRAGEQVTETVWIHAGARTRFTAGPANARALVTQKGQKPTLSQTFQGRDEKMAFLR